IGAGGGASESNQIISIIQSKDGPDLLEIFEKDYVSPASTGSLRIKPKPNANGTVQITVRVQDDGPGTPSPNVNFITRTFDFVITSVNDLPEFVSEEVTQAEPGKPYQYSIEVLDVDGDIITLTVITKPAWLTFIPGANGQATLSGTPPANTSGDFTVELQASDPTGSIVPSNFTITVNSRPVVSPVTVTLNEDEPHTFNNSDFAPGFADADSNPIAEIQITKLPVRGTLTFKGNPVATGDKIPDSELSSLIFTPLTDSTVPDTLRWNASDGFMLYSLLDTYAVMNIVSLNDAPVITVIEPETDTIKYELGSEVPRLLTPTFTGIDPDGDNITSAEIGFKRIGNYQYREEKEQLLFESTPKISGSYNEAAGILTLEGIATPEEYSTAIKTIRYNYENVTDLQDTVNLRSVYVALSDTKGATSLQKARTIR
ncbi:MAG: hypothetical protein C0490_25290, partial [Marivirga sp.]|nr:hypothetical protein [Marivirga sp.]